MGGAADRDDGGANPPVPIPPSVSRPQSPPQGLLENAGPAGGFAFVLRQQHFARPRQQHEADELNELAASGAREANDRSSARLTAITARTRRKLSFVPSIPWKAVYHTPCSHETRYFAAPEAATCFGVLVGKYA
jgi:hypothetical protein